MYSLHISVTSPKDVVLIPQTIRHGTAVQSCWLMTRRVYNGYIYAEYILYPLFVML